MKSFTNLLDSLQRKYIMGNGKILTMPDPLHALPGRPEPMKIPPLHHVNNHQMTAPYPSGTGRILLGMGCFWGAERRLWQTPGVWVTAAGYAGGFTPNPTYEEVCSGQTGHTEVVQVIFNREALPAEQLFRVFWESHNPTQGMRQGNDQGTQYRSAIYVFDKVDLQLAEASRDTYQATLNRMGILEPISTEINIDQPFYFAEPYHQQYLAKNPAGYCGLKGLGIAFSGE